MVLINKLKKKLYPLISQFLANATLVEGILKGTDKTFRCLFIENSNMMEYVCTKAYESYPHILKKWKIWIPDLHKTIRGISNSYDLCITVLSKKHDCLLSKSCDFNGDEWVRQYIDTSGKWEIIKNRFHQKKRQYTNNISHKYGLSYRISNNLADFDLFYTRMHVPLIMNKFDNQAYIESYEVMKGYFKKGLLLLVTADNQDIAGGLCLIDDDVMFFRDQGVLDGLEIYTHQGAQLALYYFVILYAWENGIKKLDAMKTRASLNDGVYRTKREWGATVYADYESNTSVSYVVPSFSETISAYFTNNPAIINGEDGLYGLTGWVDGHDVSTLNKKELFKKYFSPGLKGLILLAPDGRKSTITFEEIGTKQGPI